MKVDILDYMGDDLAVVNAARVSFSKESKGVWMGVKGYTLTPKDERLIHYLASHNHFTPFTHCFLKFRIKAPIFVARQLFKHKVGLTENEVSRRYVDSTPELYMPLEGPKGPLDTPYLGWRRKATDKKQGSGGTFPTEAGEHFSMAFSEAYKACLWAYEACLELDLCPEQARMVLPQAMYTEWIWSGSLYAFSRIYNLRTSEDAQAETKEIALKIGELIEPLFPVSWKELTNAT